MLFAICQKNLKKSYFVEDETEIDSSWFQDSENIGISGSASTPKWLMEKVKKNLVEKLNINPEII